MAIQSSSDNISQNVHNHTAKDMLEHLHFPQFRHEHPPMINVNEVADDKLTVGQKVADTVAATVGSWRFIIIQSTILLIWLILNSIAWAYKWDPYPFILLNLALSFQAAYAAPFVMMSQNRQSEKDRLTAQNDYATDVKGEGEICHIMDHLDHQDTLILQIVQHVEEQNKRIDQQEHLIVQMLGEIKEQHKMLETQRQEILFALQAHPEGLPIYLDKSMEQQNNDTNDK